MDLRGFETHSIKLAIRVTDEVEILLQKMNPKSKNFLEILSVLYASNIFRLLDLSKEILLVSSVSSQRAGML